jgi:hypothetical protein
MKPENPIRVLRNNKLTILCMVIFTLLIVSSCAAPAAMDIQEEAAAAPPQQEVQFTEAAALPLETPTVVLEPTIETILPTAGIAAIEPTPAAMVHHENRLIEIEWPAQMRVGDSDIIRLSLVMDEQGQITPTAIIEGHEVMGEPVKIPNLYETHNLVAEARLDLLGIESLPQGTVSEPLSPGKTVNFYWNIQSHTAGVFRGTLWLHVNIVPRNDDGQIEKVALLAKPIEIESTTILGMSSQIARIFSLSGSLLSTIIGFPFLESILKFLWKMLRKNEKNVQE